MPRRKGKKLVVKRYNDTDIQPQVDAALDKSSDNYQKLKSWIESIHVANFANKEPPEIDSNEDSDQEQDCDLKELEKPLKRLLALYPDFKKASLIECEWNKCNFETINENSYYDHVHNHLNNATATAASSEDSQLTCLWNLCKFKTESSEQLTRHVDFHAYHTKLKTFGLGLMNTISIPNCLGDSKFRNVIPPIDDNYECKWRDCSETFTKINVYLEHVNHHLAIDYQLDTAVKDRQVRTEKITCHWEDCGLKLPSSYQLKRHIKMHTGVQKMIGCTTCGRLYSNKTLFIDHCLRQAPMRNFQCTECFKYYATERLLRDHARCHVNKFQCNICGMSCQKESILTRHIRYRHVTTKPFGCDQCGYRGTTKKDLELHCNIHKKGNLFKCEVFQCNYSSRTMMALKRHVAKDHLHQPQTYQCHCCKQNFRRGNLLSKHLMRDHAFELAPGHSRFIYKQDVDGYYRLQTKRVESFTANTQTAKQVAEEDTEMNISYEIEKITDAVSSNGTPINVQMMKIKRPKHKEFLFTEDDTTQDSKDINDFAIVKNYKKIMKRKKLEEKE